MKPNPTQDHSLFTALQCGNDNALDLLIARWERPLFAFAWRYMRNSTDAQDLVAEVFVRLYQQRSRLREDTNVSAWLFTTLTNLCHNQHRWRRRHPTVSMDEPDDHGSVSTIASGDTPAAVQIEHDEKLALLSTAIDHLPHDLKVTLLLHYHDELSYREIGEVTGCSERGVETRLYRARQRLREELGAVVEALV